MIYEYGWPSILVGSTSVNSTKLGLKIFDIKKKEKTMYLTCTVKLEL